VDARRTDLVDPTRAEVLAALRVHVDPEVVETLAAGPSDGRDPRPVIESHGAYVFGVLMAASPLPDENRVAYQEVDFVATPTLLVTVRKTPSGGGVPTYPPAVLHPAVEVGAAAGALVHKLIDDVADSYLTSIDEIYGEIEADFERVLPVLGLRQREWLADAVGLIHPEHRWLSALK
jgi:Mg2+ and Co2+ transporter CorA